jgi:two-component system chemotaxis response regulator CheB
MMKEHGVRPLRVLAVDDSAVMRGVLRTVFDLHTSQGDSSLPRMELCGLMRDGVEGLEAVKLLAPDVLLLDLEMPRMDGLQVLQQLKTIAPGLPVIMCSAHTARGARSTLDALSLGAKDYVMKPGQQKDFAAALDLLMDELLPKIAGLARLRQGAAGEPEPARITGSERWHGAASPISSESGAPVELVVIGVSTGGPTALELMLPMLPRDFAVPVMIVQHMPRLFTNALAERLDKLCKVSVQQARSGEPLGPGGVWLAPGDSHMEVAWAVGHRMQGVESQAAVKLHQGPALNSCMPSVDYLFRSAAATYGPGTLAVMMTGMGSDGLEGARAVRAAGGTVLAQDEATSAVWGMPGRVAQEGLATALVPLPAIAGMLLQRVQAARYRRSVRATAGELRREVVCGLL